MRRIEDLAQRIIERSLAQVLGSRLNAHDVLRALIRAIEDAQIDGSKPTHFWITLNEADLRKMQAEHPQIADDLAESARQVMIQLGVRPLVMPIVWLQGSAAMPPHQVQVRARASASLSQLDTAPLPSVQTPPALMQRRPFLIVDGGRQVELTSPRLRIGRALDNDLRIEDRRVSRHHLELIWQDDLQAFLARDLQSSGGTTLNGYPIQQCNLEAGDVLSLNGVEIIYGERSALHSTRAMPAEE